MTARRSLAIAAAALLCGVGDIVLVLRSEHFPHPEVWAACGPAIAWSYVGTGLFAWRRRRDSRFGALMTLLGFAWFLAPLPAANAPLVFTLGILAGGLPGAMFGHLMLSFPSGRLPTRARRRLVTVAYLAVPLAPVPALLVSDSDDVLGDCVGACPRNVLLVSRDEALGDAALALGSALTLGLSVVAVGMLVRQWRAAAPPERRALAPVFAGGGAMLGLIAVHAATRADAVLWLAFAAVAATPFAFLAGLARADVSGSRGVRRLVAELARAPARDGLRDGLARALGDPGLELAFWMPEVSAYVDAAGAAAELPRSGDARRTVTEIDHHGERVAAIVHDRAQDADTVRAAGAAAALVLQNHRLDAELRARLLELRASRARLVEAADAERRRLERDLHDGAQSRLVALAVHLRLARMGQADGSETAWLLDDSIGELQESLTELRHLAGGLHPAVLSERGLGPAVRALAARAAIPVEVVADAAGPLPASVETAAYFVVSEALTNVAKHAQAAHATVRVERAGKDLMVYVSDDGVGGAGAAGGSGVQGLVDRVAALGGTLELSSPAGRGTRLRAHLPCA